MIRTSTTDAVAGTAVLILAVAVGSAPAWGAAKIEVDEDTWVSLGAGARPVFRSIENRAPSGDGRSADFAIQSARIYVNGQINKYLKFEFNTECIFCEAGEGFAAYEPLHLLDAIAKFEFNPIFNLWAGRLLTPSNRNELSGPYFQVVFDFQKTPFYPSDFSLQFGTGGAGVYARDDGLTAWGGLGPEGRFRYAVGVYNGLESGPRLGPNQDDSVLLGGRFEYQFLGIEDNPGYYKSGTYYGKAGDVFTLGYVVQHQSDGVGSFTNPGDFLGMNVDVLFEKVLPAGVFTLEGEYKWFESDYNLAAFADPDCFCMFDGDTYHVTLAWMFAQPAGWGKFQPYVRYTAIEPDAAQETDEVDVGFNYIIDGHNARMSVFYQHGEINSGSQVNFNPAARFEEVGSINVGFQMQI